MHKGFQRFLPLSILLFGLASCEKSSVQSVLEGEFQKPFNIVNIIPISPSQIEVSFDCAMDANLVGNLAAYHISDPISGSLVVSSATINPGDRTKIQLTTDPVTIQGQYTLTISESIALSQRPLPVGGAIGKFAGIVVNLELLVKTIPTSIFDGSTFSVSLEIHENVTQTTYTQFNSPLNWALIGSGNLQVINSGSWINGQLTADLSYTAGLTGSQTVILSMIVNVPSNINLTATITNILVEAPLGLDHFQVTTSSTSVNTGQLFNLDITAKDRFDNVFSGYNGNIDLQTIDAAGQINPPTASGFINGVIANLPVNFGSPAPNLKIKVVEQGQANNYGISPAIEVKLTGDKIYILDLIAVPISSTSVRLTWSPIPSCDHYNIYKQDSSGNFIMLYMETNPNEKNYSESALTTNQLVTYKIEAVDSASTVLSSEISSTSPRACSITYNAANYRILTPTTWSKANSPYCVDPGISLEVRHNLTIEPGVAVLFGPNSRMQFYAGFVKAVGNSTDRIVFTSSSNAPTPGSWGTGWPGAIEFDGGILPSSVSNNNYLLDGTIFKHLIIEYPTFMHAGCVTELYFENVTVRFMSKDGWYYDACNIGDVYMKSIVFVHNNTDRGIFLYQFTKAYVDNSIFLYNFASVMTNQRGAAINFGSGPSTTTIQNSYFIGNHANADGGAIVVGAMYSPSTITINNNLFINNDTNGGYAGGAICTFGGDASLDIQNNSFKGNTSTYGGGIYLNNSGSNVSVSRNYFENNGATSNQGGAIYVANAGAAAFDLSHNSFNTNYAAVSGANLFNGVALNHDATLGYWNGNSDLTCTANKNSLLGIADACGGGGSGTINVNPFGSNWVLCSQNSADVDCVGAT